MDTTGFAIRQLDQRILELQQAVLDFSAFDDDRVQKETEHYPDCCGPTLNRAERMDLEMARYVLPKLLLHLRRNTGCIKPVHVRKYLGTIRSKVGHCHPVLLPEIPPIWKAEHPGCVPFEAWERAVQDTCELTYDLKVLEPVYDCLTEPLTFTVTLQKLVDVCKLDLKLEVETTEQCELDFKVYTEMLKNSDCSLSFSTYLQLLACGITFDLLSELAACGIYLTYNTQERCPEVHFGTTAFPVCAMEPVDVKLKP